MTIRKLMLCAASWALLVSTTRVYGLELKYYWRMDGTTQRHVCEDAVLANPDIVKRVQTIAERYLNQIQSDLVIHGKSYPSLIGIGQAQLEVSKGNETGKVVCGLYFQNNTQQIKMPSGWYPQPNKDGCVVCVWVRNILADRPPDRRYNWSRAFLVHEMEMEVYCLVRFSEQNRDIEESVRALIEKRIKDMCEEMKKLQTAEDKAAGEGQ